MIEGKDPIHHIDISSLEITPEKFKATFVYKNKEGYLSGFFEGTPETLQLSDRTQEIILELLDALEKDLYKHLFLSMPEEKKEEKQEEKKETMEEWLGVKSPAFGDEYDL